MLLHHVQLQQKAGKRIANIVIKTVNASMCRSTDNQYEILAQLNFLALPAAGEQGIFIC
jgi:hypothetical protein